MTVKFKKRIKPKPLVYPDSVPPSGYYHLKALRFYRRENQLYGVFEILDTQFAGQHIRLSYAYYSVNEESRKYAIMELSRMAYCAGIQEPLKTTDDLIGARFRAFVPVGKYHDHDDYHMHVDHYEPSQMIPEDLH